MIKIGSDFSGVGAFDQALIRLGIPYKTVFACDMDKYARKTFIVNYGTKGDLKLLDHPDVKFCDDIYYRFANKDLKRPTISQYKKLLEIQENTARLFSFYYPWNVKYRVDGSDTDIEVYSPPCQSFSLAGKRKGQNDKRGVLFYNSHSRIMYKKPRYFIFENVKGLLSDDKGRTFQIWIDMLGGKSVNGNPVIFPREDAAPYHIYHKVLNSKHFGVPQNRERVFIVGIRDDVDNNFNWPKPFPLELKLRDVLEKEVDEKYFLSDKMVDFLQSHSDKNQEKGNGFRFSTKNDSETATAINARCFKMGLDDNYIKIKSATKKGYEEATPNDSINFSQPNSETRRGRVGKEVAQTLDTACNQGVFVGARIVGRNPEISNVLSTVQKDNVVVYGNLKGGKWDKTHEQSGRVYNPEGIAPTVLTMGGGNQEPKVVQDYQIRRLTPRECFRLMDFPDIFKMPCSDSQMYKQAGNSIVVNVLCKIISNLKL